MARLGLTPWRMDTDSYLAALTAAEDDGVDLPIDTDAAPPTPWDPDLQTTFTRHRLIVTRSACCPACSTADRKHGGAVAVHGCTARRAARRSRP